MNETLPLRDIHLPEGVNWWPLAPGWWLLLVLLILAGMVSWAVRTNHRRRQLRLCALAELQRIEQDFDAHGDGQCLARDCSVLLRRVCISRFPRHDVAGLTGEAWLAFLNRHAAAPLFQGEAAAALLQGPYQKSFAGDGRALLAACRAWLQQLSPPGTTP